MLDKMDSSPPESLIFIDGSFLLMAFEIFIISFFVAILGKVYQKYTEVTGIVNTLNEDYEKINLLIIDLEEFHEKLNRQEDRELTLAEVEALARKQNELKQRFLELEKVYKGLAQ